MRFTRKPGLSFTSTGSLPMLLRETQRALRDVGRGVAARDDFDELHLVDGIEEVQADDAARVPWSRRRVR